MSRRSATSVDPARSQGEQDRAGVLADPRGEAILRGSHGSAAVQTRSLRSLRSAQKQRERVFRWSCQVAIIVILLALWQGLSGRVIPKLFISDPLDIVHSIVSWSTDGTLARNGIATIISTLLGFGIGGGAALIVGYILGVSKRLADIIEPFITALWGLPRVALIPLLMIWVGVGAPLAVSIAAILSFFLLFYNTFYGIRNVSQALIDAVRVMGGGPVDLALRVRLPSALVWIAAGVKMSLPMALVGVVTAEMLGSNKGLGYLVQFAANSFDTAGTFAALIALLVLGVLLERGARLISSRALAWKQSGIR